MNYDAFLRTALSKYRHPEITKKEALNIMRTFNDLRPIISNYVFNDGTRKDLVCLEGTIPVTYKGKTYNIPVCIYLLDTHPYNPPLIYVRPTATMQIKPNKHVDHMGRVYLPYLHEWKHPTSDLMGVIQILSIIFGEEPPVFAKPTAAGVGGSTNNLAQPARTSMPQPNTGGWMGPQLNTGNMAPYPVGGTSYPMPLPSIPNYNQQNNWMPPQPNSYPAAGLGAAAVNAAAIAGNGSMKLSEEERRLSLLSAVEDKMKRRLKEVLSQAQAETDVLRKTQEDLNRGHQKLEDMLRKIQREQTDLEKNIELMESKDAELCQALKQMKVSDEVSIDDAVYPSTPLYKQLLSLFAEEQSVDDAIYYLGEALNKNVIELDVFLKHIRELSRRQFMMRMIIQKCRQKAGLPDISLY